MEGLNGIVGKWSRRLTYVQHHEICTKVLRQACLADLAFVSGAEQENSLLLCVHVRCVAAELYWCR